MPTMPISSAEFSNAFKKCRPPSGWPQKIAIANSGGPDSTCLLFLVCKLVAGSRWDDKLEIPRSTVSLTVNHQLQPSGASMADASTKTATRLGAEHITSTVNWGHSPYPTEPKGIESLEEVARYARYHALFSSMGQAGASVIAFGHHADDQVETALMRLSKGSTAVGAAGMRRVRRWGMGFGSRPGDLGWAGHEGMHQWIVRPLLDFPKRRIVATCEVNGLHYVTDATNYQPELTLRNALRRQIAGQCDATACQEPKISVPALARSLQALSSTAGSDGIGLSIDSESLTHSVHQLGKMRDGVDTGVAQYLKTVSTPYPGTALLTPNVLKEIQDAAVRYQLVVCILRFVSPKPWGSIGAEAGRRTDSIDRIISRIFSEPLSASDQLCFAAGGEVLWRPVQLVARGLRFLDKSDNVDPHAGATGWLASRQPPLKKAVSADSSDPLVLDVTNVLKLRLQKGAWRSSIQWDNRFLIQFDLRRMDSDIRNALMQYGCFIEVTPSTRWFLPHVELLHPTHSRRTLLKYNTQKRSWIAADGVAAKPIRVLSVV